MGEDKLKIKLKELKKAYEDAKEKKLKIIKIKDVEFVPDYLKYLIEHLEVNLKAKPDTEIELTPKKETEESKMNEKEIPRDVVEEIVNTVQRREIEELLVLVDKFLESEEVQKNLTFLKEYYIAEYLLNKENKRPKRSDVLSIRSTPKKKEE